jgi:predicted AAA+ superfamily ATPase
MPAVVSAYAARRNLVECQTLLDALVSTFQDDFGKYRRRLPATRLSKTLRSVALQAGGKFVYSSVSEGMSHADSKRSLDLLERAGLVHRAHHTDARGLPLGAQADTKRFKALLFDAGIWQRFAGLNLAEHLIADTAALVNRGAAAELFVGLQLAAGASPFRRAELYYWHREARSSNAEVDYVLEREGRIFPLEVKSGRQGGMKSMHLFLAERGLPAGIRLSQENFGRHEKIVTMPVYAAGLLVRPGLSLG